MLGRGKGPIRAAMKQATALYLRGALEESVAVVAEARHRALLHDDGLSSDEVAALAEGWELQARVELDRGRLQAALESFSRSEQTLEGFPEHGELRGRICFQVAQQLFDAPNMQPLQSEYEARARALLTGSEKYGFLLEMMPDDSGGEQEPWQIRREKLMKQVEALEAKRGRFLKGVSQQDMHRIVDLHMKLAYLCIEEGDDCTARESFVDIGAMAVTVCKSNIVAFFMAIQIFGHILDRPYLNLSGVLRDVSDMAMRLATSSDSSEYLSDAYFLAALHDREVRRPEGCLTNVLASIWHEQRYQVNESASVLMRAAARHRLDGRRALAADAALELGQTELLAELIEGARLQALADAGKMASSDGDVSDDLLGLLATTGTALADVHPVSVNGRSRIFEAAQTPEGPQPLALEPAIAATGGSSAVYWGSWAALRKYYWTVRSADGSWSAGVADLGPSADALLAANRGLRPTGSNSGAGLFEDYEQELSVDRELGRMVLPQPLADIINVSNFPISLVVAGSFVSDLPLPALVIPGTSDERLVERAVIRMQPPLVLTKNLVSQLRIVRSSTDHLIVKVACLDPSGDLPFSRNFDIPHELLLTSVSKYGVKAAPRRSFPASRKNLIASLQEMRPGEPALFLYSGHVDQNGIVDGPKTSLRLMDSSVSAAELGAVPIPSHVILSACSSSGASGTGAGEWLGLAGSLLRGGAREIVATAWPILDTEFTAHFERNLINRICADGDSAAALRQSQLEALANWRGLRGQPIDPLRSSLPRTWAAFQMIGVTN